jgi:hypothetical protein
MSWYCVSPNIPVSLLRLWPSARSRRPDSQVCSIGFCPCENKWYGWSLKAEYLHFDFGSEQGDQTSISDPPIGHVYENWTVLDADTFKVGINYHFSSPEPLE